MCDRRTGHMLTHQKTKPFVCMEQGCSTSCCHDLSLRRHYEVEHGLCILKEAPAEEEACGDSSPAHEVAGQPAADGLRSLVPPEARSPGSLLPNRDPLRSIGGNTYQLPDPVKEESTAGGCNQQNGGPADWAEPRSTCVCRNCSPMFHTQEGLTSHTCFPNDQWLPPRGNQDQQGQDGDQKERDAEETSQPRKRRKRPQTKASFLPPAPSASGGPGPEEGHQSCLRSPVLLVDHSLQGLCPRSPDTPSPVLSPIREGSGLDSSTLCSMSTQAGPDKLISTELGE
ncbi:zinc finger protein 541-like [Manis javanica]|uniref:zinc finger protein 541-like n=1 Tax=Manis javanica TaxID=9974 RepID=UPI003C6D6A5B